jgi:hypothetical protein
MFNNVFPKSAPFMRYVEKYGGATGSTNDVTIWRIYVACWVSKVTSTYTPAHTHVLRYSHAHADQYVILIAFPRPAVLPLAELRMRMA